MSTQALCKACGRPLPASKRASSPRVWCSQRCRTQRVSPADKCLEALLDEMLDARAPGASLCPSEVARAAGGEDWRSWMERVRRAGRRMAARGELEFAQKGRRVDAALARGPVRLRRPRG